MTIPHDAIYIGTGEGDYLQQQEKYAEDRGYDLLVERNQGCTMQQAGTPVRHCSTLKYHMYLVKRGRK